MSNTMLKDWPRYRLSVRTADNGRRYLFLENKAAGNCDYPLIVDRRVLYDRPEAWPKYVRDEISRDRAAINDAIAQ